MLLSFVFFHSIVFATPQLNNANLFSYKDAVSAAVNNNPNQQANVDTVESYRDEAQAAHRRATLPSLSISGIATPLNSNSYRSQQSGSSSSRYQDYEQVISVSGPILNKPAIDEAKAAEFQACAIEARYKSNDSFTQNTAGALAQNIFELWKEIAITNSFIDENHDQISFLTQVAKYIEQNELATRVQNKIAHLQTDLSQNQSNIDSTKLVFRHITFIDLPDEIENLEQTNSHFKRETSVFEKDEKLAIITAKSKNQSYRARYCELQAAQKNAEAESDRIKYPTINWEAGNTFSYDHYADTSDRTHSRSGYVGINIQYSIDPGSTKSRSAVNRRVDAAQKNLDYQNSELEFQIHSDILNIQKVDRYIEAYAVNIKKDHEQIEGFFSKLSENDKINAQTFEYAMSLLDDLESNKNAYRNQLMRAISLRYELEASLGTLFDSEQLLF